MLEVNKIYCGDCLELLKEIPDESVDCVITSPPYYGLRDYKTESIIWDAKDGCEHDWNDGILHTINLQAGNPEFKRKWREEATGQSVSNFCNICGAWKGSLGLEPTYQLYICLEYTYTAFKRIPFCCFSYYSYRAYDSWWMHLKWYYP